MRSVLFIFNHQLLYFVTELLIKGMPDDIFSVNFRMSNFKPETSVADLRGGGGARRARVPPSTQEGRQVMFLGHIFIDLTVLISCFVTILSLYNYLRK